MQNNDVSFCFGWEKKPEDFENINFNYENQHGDSTEKNKINVDYDVIIVLAGGIKENYVLHEWTKRRIDITIDLYKSKKTKILCSGGGTYHVKPLLNDHGYVIHESTACAKYMIENGVNKKDIYKEWSSYDTIGNAYFTFTNFIVPMKIKKAVIVTSDFHINRTKLLFNWMKLLFDQNVFFDYVVANDIGLEKELEHRIIREKESCDNIKNNLQKKISSVSDFVKWFFEEHKCYSSYEYEIEKVNKNISKTY